MPKTPTSGQHLAKALSNSCSDTRTSTPASERSACLLDLASAASCSGDKRSLAEELPVAAGLESEAATPVCATGMTATAVKKWAEGADMLTFESTVNWDAPILEADFLYRQHLSQLRQSKQTKVTRLAIFDFDNTLFKSPLPNRRLWDSSLVGMLQSTDLGWFQDSRTLSAPCLKYTDGHWVGPVEQLIQTESARSDTLVMLLTGRSHRAYRDIVLELVGRRKNLRFDIVVLKETRTRQSPLVSQVGIDKLDKASPKPPLTFDYKMGVVEDAVAAFPEINEIVMWDDRIHHCERMQIYLDALQTRLAERIVKAEVCHVPPQTIYMNEKDERKLVYDMVSDYNGRVRAAADVAAAAGEKVVCGGGKADSGESLPVGSLQLKQYVGHTGVNLNRASTALLQRHVRCPSGWFKAADQMVLALGPADTEELRRMLGAGLGDSVKLVVDSIGTIANAVVAVRVSQIRSKNVVYVPSPKQPALYITVAYNISAGFLQSYAKNVKLWRPLRLGNLVLQGVLGEHMLTTASIVVPEVVVDEVKIGGLVCQQWPELKGRDIGAAVAEARQRMAEQGVENLEANRGAIVDIVRSLF